MKLIKIGGSIITNKNEYLQANFENIKRIAMELSEAKEDFILVHGAGSFGHIKALEYGLDNPTDVLGKEREIARVMHDVLYLNSIILNELINNGIPAISLPPHAIFKPDLDIDVVENLIISGFNPVLYGDGFVWNAKHRIISGDEIIEQLVRSIPIDYVIFATDVDGLFTKDPKVYEDAKFISNIKGGNYDAELLSHDATGSMLGKMKRIENIAKYVSKVLIINGNVPGRIKDALNGKEIKGTVIEA